MERINRCIREMNIECLLTVQNNDSDNNVLWGLQYMNENAVTIMQREK